MTNTEHDEIIARARATADRMREIIASCTPGTYPPAEPISYVTDAKGDEDGDGDGWTAEGACGACGILTPDTLAWWQRTMRGTICNDCHDDTIDGSN